MTDIEGLVGLLIDHQPDQGHDGQRHTCSCSARWSVTHQAEAVAAMLGEARAEGKSRIRRAITQPHLRASTDQGPDYCSTCSEAVQEWVTWPCEATAQARAEVVRDVEAVCEEWRDRWASPAILTDLRAALARHTPSVAAGAP
jgi:hypothetical protein